MWCNFSHFQTMQKRMLWPCLYSLCLFSWYSLHHVTKKYYTYWFSWFLSRLNWVQKETMWSLILYVVCSMYVVICKIDHCIHIHWCIPMGLGYMRLGHNDPWVESHMWPQQMWGQRSSRGQWPLVQVFAKRVTVSTYFHVFLYTQWSLGWVTHVTSIVLGSKVI